MQKLIARFCLRHRFFSDDPLRRNNKLFYPVAPLYGTPAQHRKRKKKKKKGTHNSRGLLAYYAASVNKHTWRYSPIVIDWRGRAPPSTGIRVSSSRKLFWQCVRIRVYKCRSYRSPEASSRENMGKKPRNSTDQETLKPQRKRRKTELNRIHSRILQAKRKLVGLRVLSSHRALVRGSSCHDATRDESRGHFQ